MTDRKLPPVAVFTPSKVPSQGVSNIAHFIHKVVNSATFKPPWTGVKRKLTFYDLKCEFYRYCAPSNGNCRHKQLKRRGDAKSEHFFPRPPAAAVISQHLCLTALQSHSINYFNGSKIFVWCKKLDGKFILIETKVLHCCRTFIPRKCILNFQTSKYLLR